jgi:hypothetical protein
MSKNQPHKELKFKKNYETYQHFYDENQRKIYESIVSLFTQFKTNKTSQLDLIIFAKINNLEWDTTFNFKKDESFILERDVLPFFESIEDYEMCIEIKKLQNDLTS